MRWPLRNQILLPMVGLMLGVLAGATLLDAYFSVSRTRGQIERQLRDVARTLSESSFPLTDSVLRQMRGLSGAEYVLTDPAGNVLAADDRQGVARTQLPETSVTEGREIRLGEPVPIGPHSYFHVVILLRPDGGPHPGARLHILYPESTYRAAWRQAAYPSLIVGAVGVGLGALLAALIAARVVGPLQKLRHQVDGIAGGDFRPLPVSSRNDEVRDLAQAVNRMAEMLAQYELQVRRTEQLRTLGQLGAGIAHQLRNAVTGCRMALDLHQRECSLRDGNESLEVANRQLVLMEKYIRRFVHRSSREQRAAEPVDLSQLVQRTLPLLKPAAEHVHVAVQARLAESPVVIRGDSEDIEQLVINLVLNGVDAAAQRHERTPMNGRDVQIKVHAGAGNRAVLEVEDSGQGPDVGVQDRLFEPLVSGKQDGAGLGLFIARDVVQRHGGTISWRRHEGRTCFLVDLPRWSAETNCVQSAGG